MTETAEKTDPALWDKIKAAVEAGSKGGKPGQWSARKAQLACTATRRREAATRVRDRPTTI